MFYDSRMADVYLGLGSNKGDRMANLRAALERLAPAIAVRKASALYESRPMYLEDQNLFYNMAIHGTTELAPFDLFQFVKAVEQAIGRTVGPRNGPREIDIDILLYDDLILDTSELTIPHPRMHERLFVMAPLEEIAPLVEHPLHKKLMVEIRDELGGFGETIWEIEERI